MVVSSFMLKLSQARHQPLPWSIRPFCSLPPLMHETADAPIVDPDLTTAIPQSSYPSVQIHRRNPEFCLTPRWTHRMIQSLIKLLKLLAHETLTLNPFSTFWMDWNLKHLILTGDFQNHYLLHQEGRRWFGYSEKSAIKRGPSEWYFPRRASNAVILRSAVGNQWVGATKGPRRLQEQSSINPTSSSPPNPQTLVIGLPAA